MCVGVGFDRREGGTVMVAALFLLAAYVGLLIVAWTKGNLCQCGHSKELHEHYRRGSECAQPGCDCTRYRPGK